MDSTREGNSLAAPKCRKRIITQARKDQNRIAQQAYRQRQKERLLRVKNPSRGLLRKCHKLQPRQSLSTRAEAGEGLSLHAVEAEQTKYLSPLDPQIYEITLQPDISPILLDSGHEAQGISPDCGLSGDGLCTPPMAPATDISSFSKIDSSMLRGSTNGNLTLFQNPGAVTHIRGDAGLSRELFTSKFVNNAENVGLPTSASSNLEEYVDSILLSYYYQQHEAQRSSCNSLDSTENSPYTMTDVALSQIPGVQAMVLAVSNFLHSYRVWPPPSSRVPPPLPDPYANSIQSVQSSTILPYIHNARCIGLDIQDLLAMRSPFYRPNTTVADDAEVLLATVRKPWIPAHLQPTLAQIIFPHHPYIDLLPFPVLRERAITLAASGVFNSMELKLDIFRDGLACRPGSRLGDSRGCGQPWAIQSWEVKPWFLRKWRLLMDSSVICGGKVIDDLDGSSAASSVI